MPENQLAEAPVWGRSRVRWRQSGGGARALSTTIRVVPSTLKLRRERLRSTSSSIHGMYSQRVASSTSLDDSAGSSCSWVR